MSRYYHMRFEIIDFDPTKRSQIEAVLDEEWYVDIESESSTWLPKNTVIAGGESSLYGGETEEQFADRIARLVWIANGGFCLVKIVATYLDNLPCESHTRNRKAFDAALADNPDLLTTEDK